MRNKSIFITLEKKVKSIKEIIIFGIVRPNWLYGLCFVMAAFHRTYFNRGWITRSAVCTLCWTLIFTLRLFSHVVNYSHEYVTFWYVWNIRTTNFEILMGTSFSQMSNFRRVKNSHVFVTPVKNSFEFLTCDKYVRILHACDRFVRMWKTNESVTRVKNSKNSCKFFTDVTNTCESFTSV